MVYLNEGMVGGGTRFTELGLTFQPKTGMALLWNNLNADGSPNPATMHCGEPVISGHKIIITKWFRVTATGRCSTNRRPTACGRARCVSGASSTRQRDRRDQRHAAPAPRSRVPLMSPRIAVVISDTGFTSTNARSQPGMVSGSTMMLDANISGNMKVKPIVITVIGVRISRPSTMKIQPVPKPMVMQQRERGEHAEDARLRPIAEDEADGEDDAARDQVAQHVAHHEPRERRQRPDGQRAEAVEQPLAEIRRQAHARVHRVEHHRLHQDAGQEDL